MTTSIEPTDHDFRQDAIEVESQVIEQHLWKVIRRLRQQHSRSFFGGDLTLDMSTAALRALGRISTDLSFDIEVLAGIRENQAGDADRIFKEAKEERAREIDERECGDWPE
jgi:hypothetical protein